MLLTCNFWREIQYVVADLPDTSIADTSTEDLNASQVSLPDSDKEDKAEKQEEVDKAEKQEEVEADKKPEEKVEVAPAPEPAKEAMEVKKW